MKLTTKNLTVPSKEVEITGFENTITIYPIGGFALMKLKDLTSKLQQNEEDFEAQEACARFALKWRMQM